MYGGGFVKDDTATSRTDSAVRKVCALDLGSNTFKAVIGEIREGELSTRLLGKRAVRLGAEVMANQGVIGAAKLAEARRALRELKAGCNREGSDTILGVATRAVRWAVNGEALLDVARDVGVSVEVADGAREGELAYLAATGGAERKLVCDFGSQSMQLAWRLPPGIESVSLDVGYERAYVDFFRHARTFGEARDAYRGFLLPRIPAIPSRVDELICLAMNTMAAFVTGKPKSEVSNRPLDRASIQAKLAEVDEMSADDFAALVSATPRVEKILPGLALLDALLAWSGRDEAIIAEAEMPVGLIVEHFERLDAL